MLYIDPDLHNPKINGIPLIVDNRINPSIAINKDDLVAENGILIEKFDDGTIKFSLNQDIQSGDNRFTNIQQIDFMSNLPSVLFKYLNALFDGMEDTVFYTVDYSLHKNRDSISPSVVNQFDLNGNAGIPYDGIPFGHINVNAEIKSIEYEKGQGLLFNFNNSNDNVYSIVISLYDDFSSVVGSFSTSKNEYFISFDDFESGTYYWRVSSIKKSTLEKSFYEYGSVVFTWHEPPYSTDCCPKNLTGPSSDFNIQTSADSVYFYNYNTDSSYSSFSDREWILFSSNFGGDYGGPEVRYLNVSWSRKDNKYMYASNEITLVFYNGWDGGANSNFYGSDDGSTWVLIKELNISNYWSGTYTFQLNAPAKYKYFKISTGSSDYGGYCSLRKIEVS